MRVVVLAGGCPTKDYPFNGIFQFEQAKALKAAGHEVIFAAADLRSLRRARPWGLVRFESDGMDVIQMSMPVGAVPPPIAGLAAVVATKSIFRKISQSGFQPDIIHAHFAFYYGMAAARCMDVLPGAALIVTEHASEITSGTQVSGYSLACMRQAYGAARAVIAVGKPLQSRIRELTGVEAVLIPNMYDDRLFSLPHDAFSGSGPDRVAAFSFVSVGHLVTGKRMERLIEAYGRAFGADPRYSLTIMGEGPERASLENLVVSLSLQERVRLPGSLPRTEIARMLRSADCFVTASENETFGLACVEALACGLPVVATRCGGPEDLVNDRNGILVDVGDIQGMADALARVAADRAEYDSREIALAASARFSSRAVAAQIGRVYGKAAGFRQPGGTAGVADV